MADSTVQKVVSRILSVLYIAAGAVKFPIIPIAYDDMSKKFVKYATVFPGNAVGLPIDPVIYQYGVGALEVCLGLGLLLGSRKVKFYCTQGLMIIMTGALFTLTSLGVKGEAITPAVCLMSLTYVWYTYWTDGKKKRM